MRHFWDMRILLAAAFLAMAETTLAACPMPADVKAELEGLITRAQTAENFHDGRQVSGEMWRVWLRAPDEVAQSALDAGMMRREVFDFAGAIAEFDRLVEYCPAYAEGWNQRAFAYYLQGGFDKALVDLDAALALQPLHVAAQSGRALTLMNLGRIDEAREQMLIAVKNNPWLSERALLEDGAPLGLKGRVPTARDCSPPHAAWA